MKRSYKPRVTRKRRPRRAYRRKGSSLKKLIKRVAQAQEETKQDWYNGVANPLHNNPITYNLAYQLGSGVGQDQMIGSKILVKGLKVRVQFSSSGATNPLEPRFGTLFIFSTNTYVYLTSVAASIITNNPYAPNEVDPQAPWFDPRKVTIHYQKKVRFAPTVAGANCNATIYEYIKLNKVFQYVNGPPGATNGYALKGKNYYIGISMGDIVGPAAAFAGRCNMDYRMDFKDA